MINLISQLSDKEDKEIWAHVPGAFDLLEHYRYAQKVAPSITGPVPWRGRFMLQASDGRMVKWNGVKLELGADNNERDATIFRALNADISVKGRSDPEMIQVRIADCLAWS